MNRKTIMLLIAGITLVGYAMFFINLEVSDDHFVATFWVFYIQAWSFALGARYAKPEKRKKGKR